MERSLYVDFDKYTNCDRLIDVFKIVNGRARIKNDLCKIIPQGTRSNIPSQVWMYVNLKESVKEEISMFSRYFGFFRYGTTYFWSNPHCGCNNPLMVRYTSFISPNFDYILNRLTNDHPLREHLNILRCHDHRGFNDSVLYQHEGYFYVPYRMCDKYVSTDSGCSAPIDIGYIKHKIPDDLNLTDNEWVTRFEGLDKQETVYYSPNKSWVEAIKKESGLHRIV